MIFRCIPGEKHTKYVSDTEILNNSPKQCWPFVRGTHGWLVDNKAPVMKKRYHAMTSSILRGGLQFELKVNLGNIKLTHWGPMLHKRVSKLGHQRFRYMRHRTGSSLVQKMACRLFGAKPLALPMLAYCWQPTWVKYNRNSNYLHSTNVFEYVVCKMSAILPWPQCVKPCE